MLLKLRMSRWTVPFSPVIPAKKTGPLLWIKIFLYSYPKLSRSNLQASGRDVSAFLSFIKSWHDVKVSKYRSLGQGVSHFLFRITLAHRFCKLITSWRCGFGLLHVPKTIPCSMKILRVLIFANFADWPRSAKISSRRKKTRKIKRRKN